MSDQIVEATVPFWGTGRSRRSAVAASLQEIQRRRPPLGWARPVCRWCQKGLKRNVQPTWWLLETWSMANVWPRVALWLTWESQGTRCCSWGAPDTSGWGKDREKVKQRQCFVRCWKLQSKACWLLEVSWRTSPLEAIQLQIKTIQSQYTYILTL